MQFSYVVIQRGARPDLVDTNSGRMGEIGIRALKAKRFSKTPIKELEVRVEGAESALPSETEIQQEEEDPDHGLSHSEVHAQLRLEAYQWPRLIFPPLKRGGHAILDACTIEGVSCPHISVFWLTDILGKIMRLTISKSQGKQPWYDARKSRWGDIFPHPPKNRALVRIVPDDPKMPFMGQDFGKRGDTHKRREILSYEAISDAIGESRKKSKRDYALTRGSKVWKDDDDDY
jgi:hypothetical protein